jgi:uncharacterized membrane protein
MNGRNLEIKRRDLKRKEKFNLIFSIIFGSIVILINIFGISWYINSIESIWLLIALVLLNLFSFFLFSIVLAILFKAKGKIEQIDEIIDSLEENKGDKRLLL